MPLQNDLNKQIRDRLVALLNRSLESERVTCVNILSARMELLSRLGRSDSRCLRRLGQGSPRKLSFHASSQLRPCPPKPSPPRTSHPPVTLSVQHRDTAWRCYTLASFQHTTPATPARLLTRVTFAPGASSHRSMCLCAWHEWK
jgi:hypothetical protein